VLALCGFAGRAAGISECPGSRCAQIRLIPPPQVRVHNYRKQFGGCEPPPGWGWYRREKFKHDVSQPLVVIDEFGGKISVHDNW
jgi:hypothetical protein